LVLPQPEKQNHSIMIVVIWCNVVRFMDQCDAVCCFRCVSFFMDQCDAVCCFRCVSFVIDQCDAVCCLFQMCVILPPLMKMKRMSSMMHKTKPAVRTRMQTSYSRFLWDTGETPQD
jgi:hypothetical protein